MMIAPLPLRRLLTLGAPCNLAGCIVIETTERFGDAIKPDDVEPLAGFGPPTHLELPTLTVVKTNELAWGYRLLSNRLSELGSIHRDPRTACPTDLMALRLIRPTRANQQELNGLRPTGRWHVRSTPLSMDLAMHGGPNETNP